MKVFCDFFRGKKMRVKCFNDFFEGKNESDFFVIFLGKNEKFRRDNNQRFL